MTLKQMPLPAEPGEKQELSPMASEQMISPTYDVFHLLPMRDQMPLPVCDGSDPLPIASEQMMLSEAPEPEQELSSVALEDAVTCAARDVTGAVAQGVGTDATGCVHRLQALACSVGADAIARV